MAEIEEVYAPKTRPRTLAHGQTIMQYPNFGGGTSIMEHLPNFHAVLEQYALASGSPRPDDLVVATVMRCVDAGTRKHLQYNMDDSMTYQQLQEKLIMLDKNTRSWFGESMLKNFQMLQNIVAKTMEDLPQWRWTTSTMAKAKERRAKARAKARKDGIRGVS